MFSFTELKAALWYAWNKVERTLSFSYWIDSKNVKKILSSSFNISWYVNALDSKYGLNICNNEYLLTKTALYAYITSNWIKGKNNYVLIDEIQECKDFEKLIVGIFEEEKYDIYITGSNAFLLSSDLATLFTGRTCQIPISPFSFKEMVEYYGYKDHLDKALKQYIDFGGFAGGFLYKEAAEKYNYIKNEIYSPILYRDILQRYHIKNVNIIKSISKFLISNVGNTTNALPITNYLNVNNKKITNKTTIEYIDHLTDSFLFAQVNRYDLIGKKYLSSDNKFYLCDHAIKYAVNGTKNRDLGGIYENIVYWELIRRGYDVYVGKFKNTEIDFYCQNGDDVLYVQVCVNINDEKTFQREIRSLLSIDDNYEKIIITNLFGQKELQHKGIKIFNLVDWLLNNVK